MSDTIIGIDLGTTNSAAAYMDGPNPRLIPNALGDVLMPSVIGIDEKGRAIVGREARDLLLVFSFRSPVRETNEVNEKPAENRQLMASLLFSAECRGTIQMYSN